MTFRLWQRSSGSPGQLGVANRTPKDYRRWGVLRSVDDWPLAKILNQISGGKPGSVAVGLSGARRDWPSGILLLRGVCHRLGVVPFARDRTSCNLRRTTP
jgi:hypothetical protein